MTDPHIVPRVTGLCLIAAAGLLGVATLWRADFREVLARPFEDGATQLALEERINEAMPIRDISIAGWNVLRFALFGEMLEGGVAGRDGWLFTAEEYRQPPDHAERLTRSVTRILADTARLRAAGVPVIVALVPDKARIARRYLAHARPALVEARYDAALAALTGAAAKTAGGLRVVDLRPALEAIGADEAYLRQDTHWTAAGARAAAGAIAAAGGISGTAEFVTAQTGSQPRAGDLVRFVAPGPFAGWAGLDPVEVPQFATTRPGDLFGDTGGPQGVLVGTSYSAVPDWNFPGFLMETLRHDMLDLSDEGRGPFAPMEDFLKGLDSAAPPAFVIWEIPERYLTVEP